MPRLPDADLSATDSPELAALVQAIKTRRGGTLLALDHMLLHAPAFARGWSALLGPVRGELTLPARLRELAICAVAVLNRADYELAQHAPVYRAAGGTEAALAALPQTLDDPAAASAFDPDERAVLAMAVGMTRDVAVSDAVFAAARAALGSDQQMVELVGVIATYNMVSRFLVALEIA